MINMINERVNMINKRVKIKTSDTQWKDGKIITYDVDSTNAGIELEGGDTTFVTLNEKVSSQHCWIYDISKHVHPLHQITVPYEGHITVLRADGQNLADST